MAQLEMLAWLVDERGIEPHIPVFDKSGRKDGTFSRDDFGYNHETDVYVCPGGKTMTTTGTLTDGAALLYRASKHDCDACELKPRCCPNTPARKAYRVPSMKRPATGHAILPRPTLMLLRDESARRSRCYSPTSNASSNSADCDYEASAALATSSSSPQPPKNLRKMAKLIPMMQPIHAI